MKFDIRKYLVGKDLTRKEVEELYKGRNGESALNCSPNIEYHNGILLENIALDN